jgi:hypothetical protein
MHLDRDIRTHSDRPARDTQSHTYARSTVHHLHPDSIIPDLPAPVLGWRAWSLDRTGPEARLAGVRGAESWPVGEPLVATCRHLPASHAAPRRGCTCGIYGAGRIEDVVSRAELPPRNRHITPIGLVALWGEVVEGERGWRASHAYPTRLYLPLRTGSDPRELNDLAFGLSAYGVPIEILDCAGGTLLDGLHAR